MPAFRWSLALVVAALVYAGPIAAQDLAGRVVVYGRVEDALSLEPLQGVRMLSADSTSAVYTDSAGVFGILLPAEGPFAVWAERFGYVSDRFDLSADAPGEISVLRLEPSPVEIAEITAEAQAAISVLIDNLENRRNSYLGPVRAFDRRALERLAQPGSVYDFIALRIPAMFPCDRDVFQLCRHGRFRSITNPRPQVPLSICVDEWTSFMPGSELRTLPIGAVSLVEIYGEHIRVYTTDWLLSRARRERTRVAPLGMGCTGL